MFGGNVTAGTGSVFAATLATVSSTWVAPETGSNEASSWWW